MGDTAGWGKPGGGSSRVADTNTLQQAAAAAPAVTPVEKTHPGPKKGFVPL